MLSVFAITDVPVLTFRYTKVYQVVTRYV